MDFYTDDCAEELNEDVEFDEGMPTDEFIVTPDEARYRLDIVIADRLRCSRSLVQDWIKRSFVTVDGASVVKPAEKVRLNQRIAVERPALVPAIPQPDDSVPVDVVYEDEHLLVVNKRRGITVHPGSGAHSGTLVNGLLAHCHDLSGIHGVERPGIVHRLDKDTSGLMVVAKNDAAHVELSRQFADREVLKIYRALVHGVPPEEGAINQPIARHPVDRKKMTVRRGGRVARTDFKVLQSFGKEYALIELHLHTGRTHQIRVHMTWLGFPLVGDLVYGKRANPWKLEGQFLHCCRLGFTHPVSGERLEFNTDFPDELKLIVDSLESKI